MTSWMTGLFAPSQRPHRIPPSGHEPTSPYDVSDHEDISQRRGRRKELHQVLEEEEKEEAARPPYLHVSKSWRWMPR